MAMKAGDRVDVLVIGAGPTGLTMASELARYGLSCRIVDKAPKATDKSKALAIHARTLECFNNMGIVDEIIARGIRLNGIVAHAEGKELVHVTFGDLDSPYPYTISLPQSQTEQILAEHLKSFGVEVERAVELVDVKQSDGGVSAELKDSNGQTLSIESKWVVACDGAHSTVRKILNVPFEGGQYDELFALADVQVAFKNKPKEGVCVYVAKQGLSAFFEMPGKRHRVIFSLAPGSTAFADANAPTLEEMQALLDERLGSGTTMSDPVWLATFTLRHRKISQYKWSRVFFAGDAAHVHSPAGGQGMNTGIQDAYNLAWKLAFYEQHEGSEDLLSSYHTERHAVAVALIRNTDIMTRVNVMRSPIGQELRNRLAPILAGQEVVQNRVRGFISELAINYRKSPIVAERRRTLISAMVGSASAEEPNLGDWFEFGCGPSAGDRACDAHLSNAKDQNQSTGIQLFDLIKGTKHTILLLSGVTPDYDVLKNLRVLAELLTEHFGSLADIKVVVGAEDCPPQFEDWAAAGNKNIVLDPELNLHHKYGAGSESLYLIRPDGYIGFRSQPAEVDGVENYFSKIRKS